MKKILFALLLFFTAVQTNAQVIPIDGAGYYRNNNYYGNRGFYVDSTFLPPLAKATIGIRKGAMMYDTIAGVYNSWNGLAWVPVGSSQTLQQTTTLGSSTTDYIRFINSGFEVTRRSTNYDSSITFSPVANWKGFSWSINPLLNSYNFLFDNTTDSRNYYFPDTSGAIAMGAIINGVIKMPGNNGLIDLGTIGGSGVTSVSMTVPTGLSISGSPITTTGTLALTLQGGYSIPTTANQILWDSAYARSNRNSYLNNATGTGDSIFVPVDDSTGKIKRIEVVAGTNVTVTPTITADKISYSVASTGGGGGSYTGSKSVLLTASDFTLVNDSTTLVTPGKVYGWDGTTRGWKNSVVTNFTSLAHKDLMWYNSGTGQWNNLTIAALKTELAIVQLINGGANVGGQAEFYKDTLSNKLRYRTAYGANGVLVIQETDNVKFQVDSSVYATKYYVDNKNIDSSAARVKRGTYAQRIAIASPQQGDIWYQTDQLEGMWDYNGYDWRFVGSTMNFRFYDQFMHNANSATQTANGYNANISSSSTGGSFLVKQKSGSDWWLYMTSTTGDIGMNFATSSTGTENLNVDSVILWYETKIIIENLGDATNDLGFSVGYDNSITYTDGDRIIFRYNYNVNGGRWETRTVAAGSGTWTTKDAGVAVVANTPITLAYKIDGYARTVTFFIDGTQVTQHTTSDNVPFPSAITLNSSMSEMRFNWDRIAGSTSRTFLIDYVLGYTIRKKY